MAKKNFRDKGALQIFISGHRNPDIDSLAAATALAALRSRHGGNKYIPLCPGILPDRAKYLFDRFKVPYPITRNDVYIQIKDLFSRGISHLDSIGMQYHSFFPLIEEEKFAYTRYNPEHLYNVFDRYATFGKKLQITEMTIPAYSGNAEDEDIQAELLCNFYKVCFSHPAMEAIIYWNLVDGYAAFAPQGDMTAGENKYHGGLMRFDMTKKPAYYALHDLIHKEWHTEAETGTDDGGVASFRGFYGDYEIKVIADGKEYTCAIDHNSNTNNQYTVTIG